MLWFIFCFCSEYKFSEADKEGYLISTGNKLSLLGPQSSGKALGLEQWSEGQFGSVVIRQDLEAMQGRLDDLMDPSSSKILLHPFCHYNYTVNFLRSIVTAFVFSRFQMIGLVFVN